MVDIGKFFGRSKKALVTPKSSLEGMESIGGGQSLSSDADTTRIDRESERTTETFERTKPLNLLKLHIMEPLLYAGVNIYIKEVVPDFKLKCEDKDSQKLIEEFIEDVNLRDILRRVVWDEGIYGNSFLEKIPYKKDPIVDLLFVDAKTVKFLKDINGRIIEDKTRKPLGYYQETITTDNRPKLKSICSEGGVDVGDVISFTGKPFSRKQIVHYRLNTLSDTELGLGLIEPLYDTVMLKLKAEEALGKAIRKAAVPTPVATLGTPDHPLITATEKKKMEETLETYQTKDYIFLPYYIKLDQSKIEKIERLHEYLTYWVDQICSGLGIPHSVLLRGERVGAGVSDTHEDQLQKTITSWQESLARTTEREIFKPICRAKGYDIIPKIIWRRNSFAQQVKLGETIGLLTRAAHLTPDRGTEEWLRDLLGMPSIGKEDAEEKKTRENTRLELIKKSKKSEK